MLARRLLLGGSGASFPGLPLNYVGLINGAPTSAYAYVIGPISSADGGATWTAGAGAVISPGPAYASIYVKDPSLVWDGSQFVCYYCGWNGSNFQIARATASAYDGTWTNYGSNPILGVPNDGSWRQSGGLFPFVIFNDADTPKWRMWVAGSNAGVFTIGYLDSSDGLTWTDHGRVINVGSAGAFDDTWCLIPSAIKIGSTWSVFYTGYRSATGFMHAGYATCTDPADSGTYTKQGVLSGWSGNITAGGFTWRSNAIRQVMPRGGSYLVLSDMWNASGETEEACGLTTTTDLASIPVPSSLMIPLGSGWYANSAENATVMAAT